MVETGSPKGEQAQDPSPVVIGGCFLQCRYSGNYFSSINSSAVAASFLLQISRNCLSDALSKKKDISISINFPYVHGIIILDIF